MKRLITTLVLLGVLSAGVYYIVYNHIFPTKDIRKIIDYVILATTFLSAILFGIFFVLFIYRNSDKQISWLKNRLEQWSNLSVHVNKAGDEVFTELPIGIIIYDDIYQIKWVNKFAKSIFNDELVERNIKEYDDKIVENIVSNNTLFTIQVDEEFYDVMHKIDSHILYLFKVTKRELLLKEYENRTPVIGIISLDNLERETKSLDLQETAKIRGEYLGEISEWCLKYNGYLKSYDDDSLMVLLDYISLQKMMADKFTVLDKVRSISKDNGIRVTLSIGLACWDVSYEELGEYAQKAIDLAEKRGGDQVVVNIQNEKIQYFGAKMNALERNDLLAARANTLALKDAVESSSNIYIMGHLQADCDALGAMIGTLRMVQTSNKPVKIVMDYDKIDVTSQKIYKEIQTSNSDLTNYFVLPSAVNDVNNDSLLILVDTQSPKITMSEEVLNKFKRLAVIDHHRSGDGGFNDLVFSYIATYASSTVELVTEMLLFYQKEKIHLSAFEATIMLAGIVVDTNNFTFRCGSGTFEAASTLREYGVDMVDIRRLLRNEFDVQLLIAKYTQSAEIILDQFAIISIEEAISDRTMLAKISESVLNIEGVEAAFTIANLGDGLEQKVAISARSYKNINVQLVMEEMGGGGHFNGAATQIANTDIATVKEQLITILKRDFEEGDELMKVILLEDVKGRGNKNQVIDVAVGYGNFLITSKKAVMATEESLSQLKKQLYEEQLEAENQKKLMEKIKAEIEDKCVNIYIKLGNDGKLFGHVTTKHICDELEAQTGIHIDKRKVSLPVDINALGVYTAIVDLHKDVQANLEINVLEK